MIVRTSVDLPAPFGPSRPRTSEGRSSSETPSSARRDANVFTTFSICSGFMPPIYVARGEFAPCRKS